MEGDFRKKIYTSKVDMVSGLILFALGVLYILLVPFETDGACLVKGAKDQVIISSRTFPYLGGGFFVVMSLWYFISSLLKNFTLKKILAEEVSDGGLLAKLSKEEKDEASGITKFEFIAVLITIILSVFYANLMGVLGYFVATAIMVCAMTLTLGNRNIFKTIVLSIGFTYIVYYIFRNLLYVPLPIGIV